MSVPSIYHVRQGGGEDYDRLRVVFDQAEVFHRRALPAVFREPAETFPSRDLFAALVGESGSIVFVAEADDELIGFVAARIDNTPDDPLLAPRRFVTVDTLAVRADRRRQGIGRALMQAVHDWASVQGTHDVQLNVWEFNRDAIAFYEALGYRTLSRLMERRAK